MIRLMIDGAEYPVDTRSGISLRYSAAELADPQSGRNARRITLDMPATPETDRLFGNGRLPLTAERFNARNHRAELFADEARLFAGTALLAGVTRTGNGAIYTLQIKGDTALWAKTAALGRLSDTGLKFRTELTSESIVKGWSSNANVKFFPVNRSKYELNSSSVSIMPPQRVITPDDYWPFISVPALVEAIFDNAGYHLESRFFSSEPFRSLYISGTYASSDTAAQKRAMNFLAGRTSDASATADFSGRVHFSPAELTHSAGNIVDTVSEYLPDSDGVPAPTGFFSNNGCFYIDEKSGIAAFRPVTAVTVGFEFSIAYVTDYRIASRTALSGFDTLYLGHGNTIPLTLENRFEDHRSKPRPQYSYKLAIFEPRSGYHYVLMATVDGVSKLLLTTTARMTPVTMPAGSSITSLRLLRSASATGNFTACDEDWALYGGYVTETGQTEVEVRVRIPAERLEAGQTRYFSDFYIGGAEAGMKFKLLERTFMRPFFSDAAGYGSEITFSDVVSGEIRQSQLLEALGQMFNLRFCTDELSKTVFVEPYDSFFDGPVTDWSDRIDRDSEILLSDPAFQLHETLTLGYGEDDAAVTAFNNRNSTRLGRYTVQPDSRAALDGEHFSLNPIFSPTASECSGLYGARSAAIMQIRDNDDYDDDNMASNFSPRIVIYAGLRPLARNETWGTPFAENHYPLAAFHFAGDDNTDPFGLCFEDRNGVTGLHSFRDRQTLEESQGMILTVNLHLLPEEIASLTACNPEMPSVRSLYRLDPDGNASDALWTLRSIEGYDPDKATVKCTFLKSSKTL
ncbi:MAG: hypothetical protein J1E04_04030 [Alistipes sp.]|nr:hypothetical protein [Alistipes sp.]